MIVELTLFELIMTLGVSALTGYLIAFHSKLVFKRSVQGFLWSQMQNAYKDINEQRMIAQKQLDDAILDAQSQLIVLHEKARKSSDQGFSNFN